ncbi:uncharacterized protein LOC113563012 [Ooceraea biroi]|uniref:uncharacterized protein LOC113563012 n=1 Tax=Ooceraea biroi TaxID=2015173 RepID=UPI000F08B230|nr:uncharacterized protein LOC113563012 [Ooceraea biroi]
MPVNKFGATLARSGDYTTRFRASDVRGYVRDNAFCLVPDGDEYDAKRRRIRNVAVPREEHDAVNRYHVDQRVDSLSEAQRKDYSDHREAIVALRADIEGASASLTNGRIGELVVAVEETRKLIVTQEERFTALLSQLQSDTTSLRTKLESHDTKLKYLAENVSKARTDARLNTIGLDKVTTTAQSCEERATNLEATVSKADVVDVQSYARQNRGYRYILTIIDALSKYAWAVPLKRKSGSEVAGSFASMFRDTGRCPRNLHTDEGKEFYNSHLRELTLKGGACFRTLKIRYNFTNLGINHYSTHSVMKASIVERFNRTLKNEMWKVVTFNGSYKWVDVLSRLVSEYNARRHRAIAMRPVDVTPTTAAQLLSTVYKRVKIAAPAKFYAGDKVRVSKYKTVFAKGYTPNWSTEVFTVSKVQRTNPVTYLLQDYSGKPISGGFYEHELLRARYPDVYLVEKVLRRRGNKEYVKWLGMDASHNSWISRNDVL